MQDLRRGWQRSSGAVWSLQVRDKGTRKEGQLEVPEEEQAVEPGEISGYRPSTEDDLIIVPAFLYGGESAWADGVVLRKG